VGVKKKKRKRQGKKKKYSKKCMSVFECFFCSYNKIEKNKEEFNILIW